MPYGGKASFCCIVPLEAPYDFGAFGEVNMQLNAGIVALTQDYATVESLMSSRSKRWRKPKAGKQKRGGFCRVPYSPKITSRPSGIPSLYFTTRVPCDSL